MDSEPGVAETSSEVVSLLPLARLSTVCSTSELRSFEATGLVQTLVDDDDDVVSTVVVSLAVIAGCDAIP